MAEFRCYFGETNFKGQISEKFLKRRNNNCGLEIKEIKMNCKNEGLENIVFILKNNFNKRFLYKIGKRRNSQGFRKNSRMRFRKGNRFSRNLIRKKFIIPKMKFVKKIRIGSAVKKVFCYRDQCRLEKSSRLFSDFEELNLNFITSVEFLLFDNTKFEIKCSEPDNYQEKLFSENQRITGINYNYKKNYITKLNFYFHTITNLKDFKNLDYYNLLKTKKRFKKKNRKNYTIGPIGKKIGVKFQDLRRYSNWKLSAINVISDENIFSVQSEFKNIFFDKYSYGEKFGNLEKEKFMENKIFKISKDHHITKIDFFIDNLENLKGFEIFLGNTHQIFGIDKKDNVEFKKKEFLIREHESVIGLTGYYFEGKIVSLGFMVNVTALDNVKSFS